MMAGAGARVCADRKAGISIQFPFPELYACAAAILCKELDAGGFQGALHGLNFVRVVTSPASLETSHGRESHPCGFRKLYLCPIEQPSGGSALRRGHFRLPFALSFTPGSA